jgi:hypothetical protein
MRSGVPYHARSYGPIIRSLSPRPPRPHDRNQRLPSFSSNRFQLPRVRKTHGNGRWSRQRTNLSSGPSVDSSCARWCHSPIAPFTKWSSVENFHGASPSRPGASYGICRRSKPGWLHVDQPQLSAHSLPTSGNADRARLESRIGIEQRHRRRDEHRDALLARDPSVDDIRPLLHHMATLNFILSLVVDAT